MTNNFRKHLFEKTLEDYDYVQDEIESSGGTIINDSVISVNCDTVGFKDCEKIIFTLKSSLSVGAIILRGQCGYEVSNNVINGESIKSYDTGPVFYTRYIIKSIAQSICDYLLNSERIKLLAFKNIPFNNEMQCICSGVRNNRSLKILYFKKCSIWDDGCIKICQSLRKCPIVILGFENCCLTSSGVSWISWLLKEQSMIRTLTMWWPKKCQNDNFCKREHGVKKLVLNDNVGIGDAGAKVLINSLMDDKWLSQVHMQNTGLTNITCKRLVPLMESNNTLEIFDVMRNDITSIDLLAVTIEKMSLNNLKKKLITNQLENRHKIKNKSRNTWQNKSKLSPQVILNEGQSKVGINLVDSRSSLISSDQKFSYTRPSPTINILKAESINYKHHTVKGRSFNKPYHTDWFITDVKNNEMLGYKDKNYYKLNIEKNIISRPIQKNDNFGIGNSIHFKELIKT